MEHSLMEILISCLAFLAFTYVFVALVVLIRTLNKLADR
jgi:hypothetical protein